MESFKKYGVDANTFAEALGFSHLGPEMNATIFKRVEEKLKREALEDFRIDFEDGFGIRPDREEDETAIRAADEVVKGMREKLLPPFIGIRIKTFSEELKHRALRTLDLFLTRILSQTKNQLPENFVVTLPKITHVDQIKTLVQAFEWIEGSFGLEKKSLKLEIMVETPQSILDDQGQCVLYQFHQAAQGRLVAAHFGTYDYTASVNITAKHQEMDHPACDFARSFMKVAFAGTPVWLSDGATNVMPVPIHPEKDGEKLTAEKLRANQDSIHRAWALSYKHIRHSLRNGFYQGWDLHPAQLPVRYGALYAFFLEGFEPASVRLKNFVDQAAKATLVGDVFDDAATGQGLLNYFLRGLSCGAVTENEILATGLTVEEVRGKSFLKILQNRR
jgi:citrate lyase beta subunit